MLPPSQLARPQSCAARALCASVSLTIRRGYPDPASETQARADRLSQRVHAVPGTRVALEEVPDLDDVAFRILQVHGPVAPVVLDRSLIVHAAVCQLLGKHVELARPDRKREV